MRVFVPAPDAAGVRRYGTFQAPENPLHCRAERPVGKVFGQCRRQRHHGPEHAYCRQHALMLRREEAGAA